METSQVTIVWERGSMSVSGNLQESIKGEHYGF